MKDTNFMKELKHAVDSQRCQEFDVSRIWKKPIKNELEKKPQKWAKRYVPIVAQYAFFCNNFKK